MDHRLESSLFFIVVLAGAAALGACGCEATVGPCSGGDCPTVPGCEGDLDVTCAPESICEERVCNGVGWICGRDESGNYAWLRLSAPCDDKDPCTKGDICISGACIGTPLTCTTPPANTCADGKNIRTYSGSGTCSKGICQYSSQEVSCPDKCQGALCVGSPCTGIKCDNPPGECYQKTGACTAGKCSYAPLAQGTGCGTADKCKASSTCDGNGTCVAGTAMDCSRPNTTGGTCVGGACQGYQCVSGYGNCNSDWKDGCETALNTSSNCGGCGKTCGSVAHGSTTCSGGTCRISGCTSPYKDCDGVYSNGCEVPVGVANACSKSGVTYNPSGGPSGCGTAWCGSSSTSGAVNFGKWTCVFCSHCHHFPDGYSWCLYSGSSTGKFSSDRCSTCCNMSMADKVCK